MLGMIGKVAVELDVKGLVVQHLLDAVVVVGHGVALLERVLRARAMIPVALSERGDVRIHLVVLDDPAFGGGILLSYASCAFPMALVTKV